MSAKYYYASFDCAGRLENLYEPVKFEKDAIFLLTSQDSYGGIIKREFEGKTMYAICHFGIDNIRYMNSVREAIAIRG